MTVKIRVQNFQSIADSEIEVSGLTVITGANNRGKSALHRAVYGAVTNSKGTSFVRYGTPHCTVTLTFGDGHTLVWQKGDGVNSYTVDGKVLNKVGAGVPPKEVQDLGIVPIEAAGRSIWPQFAHQFTGQVFLLDQPGSVLAESIADVTRVGVLNEALRNTQSERRAASSELKVRVEDLAKLELQESSYAGLDAAEALAREAEALDLEVASLQGQLQDITGIQKGIETLTDAVGELLPVRWVEMPLSGRGWYDDLKAIEGAQALTNKLEEVRELREELLPVTGILLPDPDLSVRASKVFEALVILRDLKARMAPLERIVQEGGNLREALSKNPVGVEDVFEQARGLGECRQLHRDVATATALVTTLQSELASLGAQHDEVHREVGDLLGGVGDCPICGR